MASLHKSITSTSLNDKCRTLHPPWDNLFLLALSLQRTSADDKQSVEFESNSEEELLPLLKMIIYTVVYPICKPEAGHKQHDSHFALHRILYHSSAIHVFLTEYSNYLLLFSIHNK